MNSIKLTYINYLQMVIKFMSSDFFVFGASLLLISKRSGLVLIVTWLFGEPSITRNGQSRPFGRYTIIEIDLIRLEAVFVEMLLSAMSLKKVDDTSHLLQWLQKCCNDDLNEICWCASFVCWPKNGSGFAFITKFS